MFCLSLHHNILECLLELRLGLIPESKRPRIGINYWHKLDASFPKPGLEIIKLFCITS